MEVQVQVAGQITSKPTSNGGTKFDIPLSNGTKPSTFDAALATKISSFAGAVFTATLEQKGQYTNIVAADLGATAGTPLGGPVVAPNATEGVQATPIVPAAQNGSQGFGGMSPEREIKIVKQSMIAAAANLVGHVYSGIITEVGDEYRAAYLSEVEAHVARIAKGWFGQVFGVAKAAEPAVAATAADPQAVAAFVAEQAGSPVVQVGTEGVAPATGDLPW